MSVSKTSRAIAVMSVFLLVGFIAIWQPVSAFASEASSLEAGASSLQDGQSAASADGSLEADASSLQDGQPVASADIAADSNVKKVTYRAMYRLYNPFTGEHFYTAAKRERNKLAKQGWHYEGPAWMAPSEGDKVYRLYNKRTGDHHYTTSVKERNKLRKKGWKYEGLGWYSCPSTDDDRKPLYRQYNRHAKTGTHNYTLSKAEKKRLSRAGWRSEGVAWYGHKVPKGFKDDLEVWTPKISGDAEFDTQLETILRTHKDLQSCFNYVTGFSYISGNKFYGGSRFLPDSTTKAYAKEMIANHGGNCYRFACLFSWLARGLGYKTNVVSGWVPQVGGGQAPHGWVEIYRDGGTYLYDPDLAHELPGHGWFGCTYASAPTTYGSW